MLLHIAVAVFAVAAAGGVYLARLHQAKQPVAIPLALVHGGAAATGLVLLIAGLARGGGLAGLHAGTLALGIFVVAALGGFFLFALHLKGRELPMTVIRVHASAAVAAFLLLLLYVFRG